MHSRPSCSSCSEKEPTSKRREGTEQFRMSREWMNSLTKKTMLKRKRSVRREPSRANVWRGFAIALSLSLSLARCSLAVPAFLPLFHPLSQWSRHHKRPQGHKIEKVFLARASECKMGGCDVRLPQVCVHSSIPSAISLQTATGPREEGGDPRQSGDSGPQSSLCSTLHASV